MCRSADEGGQRCFPHAWQTFVTAADRLNRARVAMTEPVGTGDPRRVQQRYQEAWDNHGLRGAQLASTRQGHALVAGAARTADAASAVRWRQLLAAGETLRSDNLRFRRVGRVQADHRGALVVAASRIRVLHLVEHGLRPLVWAGSNGALSIGALMLPVPWNGAPAGVFEVVVAAGGRIVTGDADTQLVDVDAGQATMSLRSRVVANVRFADVMDDGACPGDVLWFRGARVVVGGVRVTRSSTPG